MIRRRYYISGHVQGVFYRDMTRNRADELGLTGWVRNLTDGRVECYLCGSGDGVETMEKWLKIGPKYAKVTNIEVIPEQEVVAFNSFRVLPTKLLE